MLPCWIQKNCYPYKSIHRKYAAIDKIWFHFFSYLAFCSFGAPFSTQKRQNSQVKIENIGRSAFSSFHSVITSSLIFQQYRS